MQGEIEVKGAAGIRPGQRKLLVPGRNCCAAAMARRAALLVDAEAYFAELDKVLRMARQSIYIIGWDFDARVRLRPRDGPDTPALGALLRALVEERPELEVRVLVWSLAAVHAPGATLPLVLGEEWQNHPRIHLHLDTHHPLHAAHHQKIVLIDDSIAFVGGMDLTIERWDTTSHEAEHPLRHNPDGSSYDPVHDLQMVADGPVARIVAQVVRERWRDAVGEDLALGPPVERWPEGLEPEFADVPMAVARTIPSLGGRRPVEESAQLTEDMLRAAEHTIYIEAQYFTARRLRSILGESLSRPRGPEIVVICTRSANGMIERFIMGANRERLLRVLKQADRYNRLHIHYPVVPGLTGDHRVLVHAKLMIVDDNVMCVGSSNLNNRSVGLDTECDLAIEADRPESRAAIAGCRERLMAEHLGVEPALVRAAVLREGSLSRAIERLNHNSRGLRALTVYRGSTRSFPGTGLLDPERPFRFIERLRKLFGRGPAHDVPAERDRTSSDEASKTLPSTSGKRK
ncbi:phospholipase D-like domain-containing protein [Chelativorans salis]|uniref:Phospholipase D n=1 Tax=Chelativorans salis TaxID=2978478 RepID=A0ABT2LRA9_9HYPH|nr:phospholipase D-like domain-containing protein [Chelativorans sp. EGI FJ00035]MCT7377085.1 phospholipase D-like domain-containing protein [Chelativorans sp. EGI FJ00035]